MQHVVSENEGGGSKAVWNFSENSSVLELLDFPMVQQQSEGVNGVMRELMTKYKAAELMTEVTNGSMTVHVCRSLPYMIMTVMVMMNQVDINATHNFSQLS